MVVDLSNRAALITGASRGIGAALAKSFAASGAHVILLARTQGALEAVDDEIRKAGGAATLIPLDLLKSSEVDKLGPALLERFGGLDIFIGNAGMLGPLTPAHQVAAKDWEKVMAVNFHANVRLARTLDPLLRASPAGRVVFTTSGLADMNLAYYGPYAASKAALNAFARIYAAETLKTNLKINLISPGMVDTAMLREGFPGGLPEGVKKPEAVVEAYLRLAASDCRSHGETVNL